jgi:hypothetical protein
MKHMKEKCSISNQQYFHHKHDEHCSARYNSKSEVSKLRPADRIRPMRDIYPARGIYYAKFVYNIACNLCQYYFKIYRAIY